MDFGGRVKGAGRDAHSQFGLPVNLHAERQQTHIVWPGANALSDFFLNGQDDPAGFGLALEQVANYR